jgi:hypothetical protein
MIRSTHQSAKSSNKPPAKAAEGYFAPWVKQRRTNLLPEQIRERQRHADRSATRLFH